MATSINQITSTEVQSSSQVLISEILIPGIQGPSGSGYIFTQSSPASIWIINHNLGFRPNVELYDSGSNEILAGVQHPSVNQTIVSVNPATAGFARLV